MTNDPDELRRRWQKLGIPNDVIERHVAYLTPTFAGPIIVPANARIRPRITKPQHRDSLEHELAAAPRRAAREPANSGQHRSCLGRTFGKLTVIQLQSTLSGGHRVYLCQCQCGNQHEARSTHLISGQIAQCRECRYRQMKATQTKVAPDQVTHLLNQGLRKADVARHFNVTRTCIQKICDKLRMK